MRTGLWNIVDYAELLSPRVSRELVGKLLRYASPFNAQLKARVEEWEPHVCRITVPNRRPLQNHLGGVHAGALATAGETAAGLVILRSFPLERYRLILKNFEIDYERQARTDVVAEARLYQDVIAAVHAGLAKGEPQLVEVHTVLSEPAGNRLAHMRSVWHLKAWQKSFGRDVGWG